MQFGIGVIYKKLSNEREFHADWLSDSNSGLRGASEYETVFYIFFCPLWVKFGIRPTCNIIQRLPFLEKYVCGPGFEPRKS